MGDHKAPRPAPPGLRKPDPPPPPPPADGPPYRIPWPPSRDQLRRRVEELEGALGPLLEACEAADAAGDLDFRVDGSLLDAARKALTDGGSSSSP